MTTYNISFEIIDALTIEFLRFYSQHVTYFREETNPALAIYKIRHFDYGELGTIRLRMIGEQSIEITHTLAPLPEYWDNFKRSSEFSSWLMNEHPEILSTPEVPDILDHDTTIKVMKLYQEWLYSQRLSARQILINSYEEKINLELLNCAVNLLGQQLKQKPNDLIDAIGEESKDAPTPWELIPDHLWDRVALHMWHEGHTNKEIGDIVCVSPRRVTNRLSELRQMFTTEIVPTSEMRRKYMISNQTRDKK